MIVAQNLTFMSLDPLAISAFESRLLGELIRPGDDTYETARLVHSKQIERFPALIVRAADAADVIRSIEFARNHDLPLAVRSGGHSIPGYGTVDDGLVLDLSGMKGLSIDPERRTVWLQPGVTSGDLAPRAQEYGLALSTGDTATVGMGGLALGGGIGLMVRKFGLAIDSLLSVEIVTADGRLIVASANQNADLFWAVRGGGGNFGIVTGFEFQLHPVGTILGGLLALPPTPDVLRGYAAYAPKAPDELTTIAMLMHLPPLPFIPAEAHGQLVFGVIVVYAGDLEEGQQALAPLRALATPLADMVGPMPYPEIYQLTSIGAERHTSNVRAGYMYGLSDDSIDLILEYVRRNPRPLGFVQFRGLGGALARVPAEATAFAHRDKNLFVTVMSMGDDVEDRLWVEQLWPQLYPQTSGVYVNFLMDEGEQRVREAYSPATYERLAEIKRRYDPSNIFSLNQNIRPAE